MYTARKQYVVAEQIQHSHTTLSLQQNQVDVPTLVGLYLQSFLGRQAILQVGFGSETQSG